MEFPSKSIETIESKYKSKKDDSTEFVVLNPKSLRQLNMVKYLKHKKRVYRFGENRSQVLRKGIPCVLNEKGLPIQDKESAATLDE